MLGAQMKTRLSNTTRDPRQRDTGITIRLLERTDASALAQLMGELGYPTRTSEMEMRLDAMHNEPRYRGFVAVSGEQVCGMVGTSCTHSYAHNNVLGIIIALVVSQSMRGNHIGQALIEAAEADFIARNIRRISITARFEREDAHQFYEHLGYTKNGFRLVKDLEGLAD